MKGRSYSHDAFNKNGQFVNFFSYYFETSGLDPVQYYVGGSCTVNLWKIYLPGPS